MRRNAVAIQAFYVRIGNAIRVRRMSEGVPQQRLAALVDVTQRNFQRYESGDVPCPLHVLVAVADELDTSLDELIPVVVDERKIA